ncbi:MAG TPA: nuclear transport factor 2 family protein [Candidatus Sulfotelmatobacter sp.]
MKSFFTCAAMLVLLVVCAVPAQTATTLTPHQQALFANEKNLIEAKKKDDAAFFKRTLAENFTLVGIDGKLLEHQEALDELGDSGLVELTPYDVRIIEPGDNVVIVSYDAILRKAPEEDQGPPPRYQHFSSIWVKQGGQWKLQFHQTTAQHWGDW